MASASQAILVLRNYPRYSPKVPKGVKGLHLTAYFNLQNISTKLLERGYDLEAIDSNGQILLI